MSNSGFSNRCKNKAPSHAPVLEKDAGIEKKIDKLFSKGGELYEYFKKKGK
jgi:hypothetical protein